MIAEEIKKKRQEKLAKFKLQSNDMCGHAQPRYAIMTVGMRNQ